MVNEEKIQAYLKEKNLDASGKNIIGVVMPTLVQMAVFGAPATVLTQYNVLSISQKGIAIIPIDGMGKLKAESLFIPQSSIQSVSYKKKLTHYTMDILTEEGTVSFRVNKMMVGAGFHKKNLSELVGK